MSTEEAYNIAQKELLRIEGNGFEEAQLYVGEIEQKDIIGSDRKTYDLEVSYTWVSKNKNAIKVSCSITSKNWYKHKQINEHITLSK